MGTIISLFKSMRVIWAIWTSNGPYYPYLFKEGFAYAHICITLFDTPSLMLLELGPSTCI